MDKIDTNNNYQQIDGENSADENIIDINENSNDIENNNNDEIINEDISD